MSVLQVVRKFQLILSRHQKRRIFELGILMVFGGLLESISVSLVLPFMDAAMNPDAAMEKWYIRIICDILHINSPKSMLVALAIALAIVYILKNIYLVFEYNIQYRFVYGNMFEMQKRLLDNFVHRPYEYFLKISSGEIIRILNIDITTVFSMLSTILGMFTELVIAMILIVTVFVMSPVITVIMGVILLGILLLISKVIKPIFRQAGLDSQENAAGMNKWLIQSIQGIKELKVMGREDFFQQNYGRYGQKYIRAIRKNQTLGAVPRFIIEGVSMAAMFITIACLICSGQDLKMLIPVISALAMAAIRLLPSITRISAGIASASYGEPMLDKLIENLKDISGNDNSSSLIRNSKNRDELVTYDKGENFHLSQSITLDNITYHYPEADKNVLDGASMVIRVGESVGIIGESGAGKTTAVDIVLGLLKPQSGRVDVDGSDICENIQAWREKVGYIPQMIFMLDDTIRANIAFGADEDSFTDDDIWKALQEASLDRFVRDLPESFNTEIGERGVRLSGGQRQRIGIARALFRNPDVLIFDEATSALDNNTETAIMEAIEDLHGHKTVIIIAHRLTTIESCDHIFKVENGKILKVR